MKRTLDSLTSAFYSKFQKRPRALIEGAKQALAKSVGTIIGAGPVSREGTRAQVLVADSLSTSKAGVAEKPSRLRRMRISTQDVDEQVKVFNIGFVP